MTILVTGGTGTVGSQVTARLTAAGVDTRVLTRSPDKAAGLPAGAAGVVGSLSEPFSLAPAFEGVDRLFLLTPLAQDEVDQGLAAVEAAEDAAVVGEVDHVGVGGVRRLRPGRSWGW